MQKFRSGENVPESGNYKAYDKYGESQEEQQTYLERGQKFPPLQHSGGYWIKEN
ncbi:MAG: YjzC family protein [Clostridia bacterium]|nr:YjzC family protein [Clostridia bacterium]